jgi:hypothetical protein
MASTQTLRDSYRHSFFVGVVTSGDKRGLPICDYRQAVGVVFLAAGPNYPTGRVTLKVHPDAVGVMVALAAVLHYHGYTFTETAGGTLSCRNITGASSATVNLQVSCQCPKATSLHLHGIAFDINPSRNQYRVTTAGGLIQWGKQTDLPPELIADVEAIKLKSGKRALEWGGRWSNTKDPMHFELDVTRIELEAGVDRTTVKGLAAYLKWTAGGTTPPPSNEEEQMLKQGDEGNAVRKVQNAIKAWNPAALPKFGADADYGAETEEWVANYQRAANLEATGNADGVTVAFLFEYLPDVGVMPAAGYTKGEADARYARAIHPHAAKTTIT